MNGNTRTVSAVAGMDIGGTKTLVVIADREGTILGSASAATPAQDGGAAMTATALAVLRAAEADAGITALALGVGAAGVIDQATGTVTAASDSFVGWAGFGLAAALRAATGVPVTVENDVNAFLSGELAYGAMAGQREVLGIALGTGVGGAIALGGEIFTGPRGAAGEIGHTPGYGDRPCTCGQFGHLETIASGLSIATRYAELGGSGDPGAHGVADRARTGDEIARRVFAEAGRAVALSIATAANLIDIGHAVIGGGVRGSWDLIAESLDATLAENPPVSGYPLTVLPSALGGHSVALGAAAQAWAYVSERTSHAGQ